MKMERSESTNLLLQNDVLEHVRNEAADEDFGFSSGYESNYSSDADAESNHGSDDAVTRTDLEDEPFQPVGEIKEVMSYQATGALCDQLKYIMSMPELCDVTFLVGPSKVPVHGVKAILGTRSRVMYQLILKQQKLAEEEMKTSKKSRKAHFNEVIIDVRKYEPEDFRKIVEFMHCGSVDVTPRNVPGLLCGARQFGLEDLKIACWDFVRRIVTSHSPSVDVILKSACKYSQHKTGSRLIRKINEHLTCPSSSDSEEDRPMTTTKKTTTV